MDCMERVKVKIVVKNVDITGEKQVRKKQIKLISKFKKILLNRKKMCKERGEVDRMISWLFRAYITTI